MEIRHTTDQDFDAFVDTMLAAFGFYPQPPVDGGGQWWSALEMDRCLFAVTADGKPVGTAGAYSFELTLPGETLVPVSGVSAVGVLPSHRRQGALRAGQPPISPAPRYVALHRDADGVPDGYASYTIEPGASRTMKVDEIITADDAVHTALARFLLEHDLVDQVSFKHVPTDHPLRWRFEDFRGGEVTGVGDWLWVRLLNVPGALTARGWFADGEIVLDVEDRFLGEHGRHLLTVRNGKAVRPYGPGARPVPGRERPRLGLPRRHRPEHPRAPGTSGPTIRARPPSPTPCSGPSAPRTACTGSDRAGGAAPRDEHVVAAVGEGRGAGLVGDDTPSAQALRACPVVTTWAGISSRRSPTVGVRQARTGGSQRRSARRACAPCLRGR